ncbi:chromate transporter [Evansella tamaricis]|uniref:Chromate transporter n=1 Tax=Evansella tamaricis TaxID=2069301 RepID=A0ABS6JG60_9BACI|nr:chromate transporter [Evansella tamaricis]MBU9712586.1 chromate transporter [Evansella tamaricis]
MLLQLFFVFVMIGAVSFGGGYAMIPVIEAEVTGRGWMTTTEFTDVIAVAGMSPGPIATNSATVVGYHVAGVPGAIVSALAMTLPSLVIILIIASIFVKINQNKLIKSAFYGLRPIVTSLIIYAAIKFAISNGIIGLDFSFEMLKYGGIFLLSLVALLYWKLHPALVIVLSGIIGIIVF